MDKAPLSSAQILWLVLLHWPGTAVAVLWCALGLGSLGAGGSGPAIAVASVSAAVASMLGSVMATSICRGRISDVEFDRGTTTARTIAVVWASIPVLLVGGSLIGGLLLGSGARVGGLAGRLIDDNVWTLIGVGSLLAIIGPGYSEYREARAKRRRPATASPDSPPSPPAHEWPPPR